MKYELTVSTSEYYQIHPGLTWADILNTIQGICGQPAKFHCVDFLIRFDWANGVAAVFCTQGSRRQEVVITIDSRNPHVVAIEQIERALDDLHMQKAKDPRIDQDTDPDEAQDIDWEDDDH